MFAALSIITYKAGNHISPSTFCVVFVGFERRGTPAGVLHWAGRLWALHESGLPYEMHPRSLDTVGESHGPHGSIDGSGPLAAHYRIMTEADDSKRCVSSPMAHAV